MFVYECGVIEAMEKKWNVTSEKNIILKVQDISSSFTVTDDRSYKYFMYKLK